MEEAGDRLFTFTGLPPSRCKSAGTTNTRERLHEEFDRQVKTRNGLPSADTGPMLFRALMASDQISLPKIDGWQTPAQPLSAQPIDLVA